MGIESRIVAAGDWKEGIRENGCLINMEVSFWGDGKNLLELDSGDGCPTLLMS